MATDVPECPRCQYHDGGGDLCPNPDGSTTYRCYECEYLWQSDDSDHYMGDDARLDACRGVDTTGDDHNA